MSSLAQREAIRQCSPDRVFFCMGRGKEGGGCTFLPQGDGPFIAAFFALWPFGGQRGEDGRLAASYWWAASGGSGPLCLAPPVLLEAILPAIQRVVRWGDIPLSGGCPAPLAVPRPVVLGWGICPAFPYPLCPERCGRGKAPAVCGEVCGLLLPALDGGPRPFWGGFAAIFQAGPCHRQDWGAISFRGEGFGGRTKREDRSAASRPCLRRWDKKTARARWGRSRRRDGVGGGPRGRSPRARSGAWAAGDAAPF
ncbi:hypothetical protein SAMN05444424_0291 [Bittarella massiliensis (ex Durand et al. 2017)]|uniref:Uncharacterized protein n=1 Tax=Bittarella massiliensis (ex Durand et al. 2017) TaxID=1720313 RepID=A0AAQ1MB86_9FIRM|nr:hypothetical protein SAMN05444424_0291 [Bittarella massiliensis (ex Durand et al. 2017)]